MRVFREWGKERKGEGNSLFHLSVACNLSACGTGAGSEKRLKNGVFTWRKDKSRLLVRDQEAAGEAIFSYAVF